MSLMDYITSLSQGVVPLLVAIIVVVVVAVKFRGTFQKLKEGDTSAITLALVTILCGTYGVERLVNAIRLERRLINIEEQVSKTPGSHLLDNYNDIYRSATKLCGTVEGQIRGLVVSAGPKAPDYFAETIAQRLKERRDAGYPVLRYDAVIVLNSKKIDNLAAVQKSVSERLAIYEKFGVKEYVHLYVLDTDHNITFDVIVVDRKHAQIGFTSRKEGKTLDSAISFENQPQLASNLADWFDGTILPASKPFDDWIKEQLNKVPNSKK